jgi:hypothetical protein
VRTAAAPPFAVQLITNEPYMNPPSEKKEYTKKKKRTSRRSISFEDLKQRLDVRLPYDPCTSAFLSSLLRVVATHTQRRPAVCTSLSGKKSHTGRKTPLSPSLSLSLTVPHTCLIASFLRSLVAVLHHRLFTYFLFAVSHQTTVRTCVFVCVHAILALSPPPFLLYILRHLHGANVPPHCCE